MKIENVNGYLYLKFALHSLKINVYVHVYCIFLILGGSCLPEISKSNIGDMFMMSCPCLDNLVCVPAAIVENKEDRVSHHYSKSNNSS